MSPLGYKKLTKTFTDSFSLFCNVMLCNSVFGCFVLKKQKHFLFWFYSDIVSIICENDTFKPEWKQLFEREWSRREDQLMDYVFRRYFTEKKAFGRKYFYWLYTLNYCLCLSWTFFTVYVTVHKSIFARKFKNRWKVRNKTESTAMLASLWSTWAQL